MSLARTPQRPIGFSLPFAYQSCLIKMFILPEAPSKSTLCIFMALFVKKVIVITLTDIHFVFILIPRVE